MRGGAKDADGAIPRDPGGNDADADGADRYGANESDADVHVVNESDADKDDADEDDANESVVDGYGINETVPPPVASVEGGWEKKKRKQKLRLSRLTTWKDMRREIFLMNHA